MSQFGNPLQIQNLGGFSVQSAPVDTTGQSVLEEAAKGLALGAGILEDLSRPPSRESIMDSEKAAGRDLAIKRQARFEEVAKTSGREVAWQRLQEEYASDILGRSIHFSSGYDNVLEDRLGSPRTSFEEEQDRALEDAANKRRLDLTNKASENIAAAGADVSLYSPDQLYAWGEMLAGRDAQVTREIQQAALDTANYSADVRKRKVVSTAEFANVRNRTDNNLRIVMQDVYKKIELQPELTLQYRTDAVKNLRLQRNQVQRDLEVSLNQAGGSVDDVADRMKEIDSLFTVAELIVTDKIGFDLTTDQVNRLSVDQVLDYVTDPDSSEFAKINLLASHLRLSPADINKAVLGKSIQKVQAEVTSSAVGGAAWVSKSRSLLPSTRKELYSNLGKSYVLAATGDDPVLQQQAAASLVANLQEAIFSPPSIARIATSAGSLPSMLGEVAKSKPNTQANQAILEAADAEGMTPEDLWIESATQLTRTQFAPELEKLDSLYRDRMTIQFTGQKFKVGIKQNTSLGSSGYGLSARELSFISAGNKMEKVLNDWVLSYAKVTGADPADVGKAIEGRVILELGLLKME